MPPPPQGEAPVDSPRDTTPMTAGPAADSAKTGPPESPKQASTPFPPAANSPAGAMLGSQPASVSHVGSVIAMAASRRRVLLPLPLGVVRPKPTSCALAPRTSAAFAVQAAATG